MLVQLNKTGSAWTPEKAWQITELTMRFSSPVRKGNLVFGFSNRNGGIFFCVDADSGKTLWTSDPKQGDNAVVLISGDLLFLLKDNAELIVAKARRACGCIATRCRKKPYLREPRCWRKGPWSKDSVTLP
jgi:hypothetical protein